MADVFVDKNGSNTSPYDTWAKASTTWATGLAALVAGQRLIVADSHTQSTAGDFIFTVAGTDASPNIIISSTVSGTDVVTYSAATAAQYTSTQALDTTFSGAFIMFGVWLENGDEMLFTGTGKNQVFDSCTLQYGSLGSAYLQTNMLGGAPFFKNCDIHNLNTGQPGVGYIRVNGSGAGFHFSGGTFSAAGATNRTDPLIQSTRRGSSIILDGVDLTGFNTDTLVSVTSEIAEQGSQVYRVTNCPLHANTTTLIENDITSPDSIAEVHNCDSSNTVYRMHSKGWLGEHSSETGIYRTAGASNGTTNYSHEVISSADPVALNSYRYKLAEMWVDVSTAKTFTVEIAQDGTTTALQDDEIWIEVEFPDDLTALSHIETNRVTDITTAPGDQPPSTEAWIGLSETEKRQKLSVTTSAPGKEGPCTVWLNIAKPSTTVYVDPKVEIT